MERHVVLAVAVALLAACERAECEEDYLAGVLISGANLGHTADRYLLSWDRHDEETGMSSGRVATGATLDSLETREGDLSGWIVSGDGQHLVYAGGSPAVATIVDPEGFPLGPSVAFDAGPLVGAAVALADRYLLVGTSGTSGDSYAVSLAQVGADGTVVDREAIATAAYPGVVPSETETAIRLARIGDIAWLLFQDGEMISGLRIGADGMVLDDTPRTIGDGYLGGFAGNGDRALLHASLSEQWTSSILDADGVISSEVRSTGGPSDWLGAISGGFVSHDGFSLRWFDLDGVELGQIDDPVGAAPYDVHHLVPAGDQLGLVWLAVDDQSEGGTVVGAPYITTLWAKPIELGAAGDPVEIDQGVSEAAQRTVPCSECSLANGASPLAAVVVALLLLGLRWRVPALRQKRARARHQLLARPSLASDTRGTGRRHRVLPDPTPPHQSVSRYEARIVKHV